MRTAHSAHTQKKREKEKKRKAVAFFSAETFGKLQTVVFLLKVLACAHREDETLAFYGRGSNMTQQEEGRRST